MKITQPFATLLIPHSISLFPFPSFISPSLQKAKQNHPFLAHKAFAIKMTFSYKCNLDTSFSIPSIHQILHTLRQPVQSSFLEPLQARAPIRGLTALRRVLQKQRASGNRTVDSYPHSLDCNLHTSSMQISKLCIW